MNVIKRFLLAGLVGLMMLTGLSTQGQTVGCNDTVFWGMPFSFEGSLCCWTVPQGSNWTGYLSYNQYDSNFDTVVDHRLISPWVEIPSFAAIDSVMLIYATQVTCPADYSVCVTTDGVNYDTLIRDLASTYQHDTLFMGAYAGRVVRIEFCHYGLNSTYNYVAAGCTPTASWNILLVNLQLRSIVYPVPTWTVPARAYVGETTWLHASLTEGSHTALTYTWHSSLTGQTLTGDTVGLAYTITGVDTLTLVVANAYGSDTLVKTVQVFDCSDTITANPWLVDFGSDFDCWRNLGDGEWVCGINTTTPAISASQRNLRHVLMSPAVQLPVDTMGLRLYWSDRRSGGISSQNYRVIVTAGNGDSLAGFDTIFLQSGLSTSWQERSVSLSAYAGQTVHLAFDVQLDVFSTTISISGVKMYTALAPVGTLEAPAYAATDDTVSVAVNLVQGADSTLTYSYYSALMDTTFTTTESSLNLVYTAPGSETLTVSASSVHGNLVLSRSYDVYACDVVSAYPWEEDFENANGSYNTCWTINGYSHNAPSSSRGMSDEETNESIRFINYMSATASGSYMITPPLAIPAGDSHTAFMLEFMHSASSGMEIKVSPTASTDINMFTDLLLSEPMTNFAKRRWVSLADYAGQTVRVAIKNPGYINRVWVGTDTLPNIGTLVAVPAKIHSDSMVLCTVGLRHGATEGLHYTWTSAVGGLIVTNALGDSAWVSYGAGFNSTEDTVTVVATNNYGADTVSKHTHIIDCTQALILPWKETFADGDVCWYKPAGSNWDGNSSNRRLFSSCANGPVDSWIMSKPIVIPADTSELVRLFWKVASTNTNFVHTYRVMVTTSNDYTDTSAYQLIYFDSATHVGYTSTYETLSVGLAQYAGQTIHIAFRNQPINPNNTPVSLFITDVEVRSAKVPVVSLTVPSVVDSHEPVVLAATLNEGAYNGLSLTWHSMLMDSTWVLNGNDGENDVYVSNLTYRTGGLDTLRVIASNIYGADTAIVVLTVNACLLGLPWMENFNSIPGQAYNNAYGMIPTCWKRYWNGSNVNYKPHVINSYPYAPIKNYVSSINTALMLVAGTESGFDSVATVESPQFDVPLGQQMLSFYYMYESAGHGTLSVGYMRHGDFVRLMDMAPQADGRTDTVRLTGIPSDVQRFALRWYNSDYWYGAIVDNISVFAPCTLPQVRLSVPDTALVGDSILFTARLIDGLTDGLTYSWYSSRLGALGSTSGADQLGRMSVIYTAEGTDTITVVATTAYGSDTAWAAVGIGSHPLPMLNLTASRYVVSLGDSVSFEATLNDCSRNGLSVIWHSSQMGTLSGVENQAEYYRLNVAYGVGGVDTMTAVAVNAYGTDTAVAVVRVMDCDNTAVPYTEDFESTAALGWATDGGQLPICWDSEWNGTHSYHAPHVITAGGYNFISNIPDHALFIVAGSSVGDTDAYVLLPRFADNLYSLSLAFDHRFESATSGTLEVGYMTDDSLFAVVKTIANHNNSYLRDTVNFDTVTPGSARIALRWKHLSSYFGVVVDNIHVFSSVIGMLQPHVVLAGPMVADANETVLYTAHLQRGDTADLTYHWRSAMADRGQATITAADSLLSVVYTAGGTDTVNVTVSNSYGSDSATIMLAVSDCRINEIPYTESFESGPLATGSGPQFLNDDCWQAVNQTPGQGWKRCFRNRENYSGSYCMVGDYPEHGQPTDDWLLSPAIELPSDGSTVRMAFHLYDGYPYPMQVWVSTTGRTTLDGFTDSLALRNDGMGGANGYWHEYSVSLAPYAGQTIHVAFRNTHTIHGGYTTADSYTLYLDHVEFTIEETPAVMLDMETVQYTCDTATAVAKYVRFDSIAYTLQWHSSMADRGAATLLPSGDTLRIVYMSGGTDTVSASLTNPYGADTDFLIVDVRACEVATQFPFISVPAASESAIYCWKVWQFDSVKADMSSTHGRWTRFPDYNHDHRHSVMSNEANVAPAHGEGPLLLDNWLVSPLVSLPVTASNITFGWNSYSDQTTYRILVSTTGRSNPQCFTDTLYTETTGSNAFGPWLTHNLDLSAYAGQTISLAFHHGGPIQLNDIGKVYMDSVWITCDTAPTHTVTLSVNDTAMGSATMDFSNVASGRFAEGAVVTLTAVPNEGYTFAGWNITPGYASLVTQNPYLLTVDQDYAVVANFEQAVVPPDTVWYEVTVAAVLADGQPVDAPVDNLVCGPGRYAQGETVTLSGMNSDALTFEYWITTSGDTIYDNPYIFDINSDVAITAVFAPVNGIGDVVAEGFSISPNPAHDKVKVAIGCPQASGELVLMDVSGRIVRTVYCQGASTVNLDVSDLPWGVYFVRLSSSVKKLVVH